MIIQHNMTAANANRQLGAAATNLAKSTEKLSSGYRINRASDDAAGLAISEKMRGQIRGLDQASTNAQDGISLIQTAEGALSESQSILQRMRELSVQASNGTETDDDRAAIQDEITQLQDELTRISTDTEFNTMKLLDGSAAGKDLDVSKLTGTTGITENPATNTSFKVTVTAITGNTDTGAINIKFVDDEGKEQEFGATQAAVTGGTTAANLAGNYAKALEETEIGKYFTVTADGTTGELTFTARDNAKITDVKNTNGATTTSLGITKTPGTEKNVTIGDTVGVATSVNDAKGSIFEVNGKKFVYASTAGAAALKNDEDFKDVNIVEVTGAAPNAAEATTMAGLIKDVAKVNASTTGSSVVLTAGEGSVDGIKLQVGANEGQTMSFTINDMSAKALGVDAGKVNVATQEDAQKATTTIDDAINKVSKERAKLGAVQNRLEHTISNLDTSSENLQTAESRIRDVDMADEMVNYSKHNILQQASQSMLAQAKNSTQGVLSLLQ